MAKLKHSKVTVIEHAPYITPLSKRLQCGHFTVDSDKLSDVDYRMALQIGVTEMIARGQIDPLEVKAETQG